jgi:diguanylate cyclase (GGDEF)-like protein
VMGWDAAHAHVLADGRMVSSGIWHLPAGRNMAAFQKSLTELVVEPGAGLTGKAMVSREPSWFKDILTAPLEEAHQAARRSMREAGFRGLLALPVLARDGVPAVLEFLTESRVAPDASLLEIMGNVGVQLGRVFEREWAEAASREQARKIELLSITDELTGLLNRRGFVTMATQQAKLCRRTEERCLLFFMDLDRLKRVNDELGHAAGDDALAQLALALRSSFRESDLLARLGGDEFVALALGAKQEKGITERIHRNLQGRSAANDSQYPLEVSIGTSWVEPDGDVQIEDLLAQADLAMYETKKKGREERASAVLAHHTREAAVVDTPAQDDPVLAPAGPRERRA